MNRARIAALLRQLADEIDERPANDAPRRRRPRLPPLAPAGVPSDTDRARARHELKRLGYRVVSKP